MMVEHPKPTSPLEFFKRIDVVARNAMLGTMLILSGCSGPGAQQLTGTVTNQFTDSSSCLSHQKTNIFMARPLCGIYSINGTTIDASQTTTTTGGDFIGAALSDSINKCQAFINDFTAGVSADNTTLDVLSLGLSALATVFVPSSTVRALSGASTITQGTKAAINSDLYQQLTVQLFIQTINSTYFKEYGDFLSTQQTLPVSLQFAKIELFHKDCSIPFAAAALSASQTKTAQATDSTPQITSDKLTDGAKFKGGISGDTYTVSVKTTGVAPNATKTYSYLVTLPSGNNTSPQPQQTTSNALLALLNADHAAAK
jgi:hypothetical protein